MQIYVIGMRKTIYMCLFIVAFLSIFFIPEEITVWFFVQKIAAFAIAAFAANRAQEYIPDERP